MRETYVIVMLLVLVVAGFFSSTFTGEAPRGTITGTTIPTGERGNRNYLIRQGQDYDVLGSPGRLGLSALFNNPFPPGKGDLDHDGKITANDLKIIQLVYQYALGRGTTVPSGERGIRRDYVHDSRLDYTGTGRGVYSEEADMDDDRQITYQDVKLLQRLVNPYLGVKTSIMTQYKHRANCVNAGEQRCTVEGKIATCEEILPNSAQAGLLAYEAEDCPFGTRCVDNEEGATCVQLVRRQGIYGA